MIAQATGELHDSSINYQDGDDNQTMLIQQSTIIFDLVQRIYPKIALHQNGRDFFLLKKNQINTKICLLILWITLMKKAMLFMIGSIIFLIYIKWF